MDLRFVHYPPLEMNAGAGRLRVVEKKLFDAFVATVNRYCFWFLLLQSVGAGLNGRKRSKHRGS